MHKKAEPMYTALQLRHYSNSSIIIPLVSIPIGGSLLSMLTTLDTLINMKEATNQLKWVVNQGVIATHGHQSSSSG